MKRTEAAPAAVDEVGRQLSEALDALVQHVIAAILFEVPIYRDIGSDALRPALRRVVEMFLSCLIEDRDLRGDELSSLEVQGSQRARQGLPLEAVTAAVEAASRAGWKHLLVRIDRLDVTLDQKLEAISRMSVRAMRSGHYVSEALRRGYLLERGKRHRTGGNAAAAVDRLIDGDWCDEVEMQRAARAVGLNLAAGALVVLVVVPNDNVATLNETSSAVATRLRSSVPGAPRTWQAPHGIVLASASERPDVLRSRLRSAAQQTNALLIIADATRSPAAIATEYRSASRDIGFASAVQRHPGVLTRRDLKFYRVLSGGDESDRADFFHLVFGRLLNLPEDDARDIFYMIDVYFSSDGTQKDIAAALQCTTRTWRSNLATISRLTGLSWKVPFERVQLEVASRLRHLAAASGGRYDASTWGPYPKPPS